MKNQQKDKEEGKSKGRILNATGSNLDELLKIDWAKKAEEQGIDVDKEIARAFENPL